MRLWNIIWLRFGTAHKREQAAKRLGKSGVSGAIGPLVVALGDPDIGVHVEARHALEAIDSGWRESEAARSAVPRLLDHLKSQSGSNRKRAADALGEVGDRQAVDALVDLLTDDDEGVRSTAASSLGKIGDARATEPLLTMALRDQLLLRDQPFHVS